MLAAAISTTPLAAFAQDKASPHAKPRLNLLRERAIPEDVHELKLDVLFSSESTEHVLAPAAERAGWGVLVDHGSAGLGDEIVNRVKAKRYDCHLQIS